MPASPATLLAHSLAHAVKDHGGRALLIGGSVRDAFFGVDPKDLDMEFFGVPEARMDALLASVAPHVIRVGRAFPVWKAWSDQLGAGEAIDIAIPRREVKTGTHHTDFSITLDPGMPYAEAAERRDFTINAIGLDPLTGEHLDPHGGIQDIKDGILRHVSPRFAEDPLRVLRGMQFASRFNLTAHPDTIAFCKGLSADGLSSERLMEEFKKLILKGKRPGLGLKFLADTGWDRYFPELANLKGVPQDSEWHPEGDAYVHTLACLDAFAARRTGNLESDLRTGLAVLCHDFGKVTHTGKVNGRWTAHGHEEAGQAPTEIFLRRMTDQTELIQGVKALVGAHMTPRSLFTEVRRSGKPECVDSGVRRLALKLSSEHTNINELCLVCECDKAGRPPLPINDEAAVWLRERAVASQVLYKRPMQLLMGRDLIAMGLIPGIGFKAILEDAFNRQVAGEITTRDEALAVALNRIPMEDRRTSSDVVTLYRVCERPQVHKEALPAWVAESPAYQNTQKASNRWFGDTIEEVAWYKEHEHPDGEFVVLRLPASLAEQYRVSNIPAKDGMKDADENPAAFSRRPEHEFFLPAHLAALATPVPAHLIPEPAAKRPPLPIPHGVGSVMGPNLCGR